MEKRKLRRENGRRKEEGEEESREVKENRMRIKRHEGI